MKLKILLFSLVTFVTLALVQGCAVTRKITAAEILSNTKLEFEYLTLDSVQINKDLFPKTGLLAGGLLPNPQVVALVQDFARGILEKELGYIDITAGVIAKSKDKDTLWIRELQATLKLDTLMELPIILKESTKMAPGDNKLQLITRMPIDRRIFKLMDVNTLNIKGVLTVALDMDGEPVMLAFDIDRPVTHEEKVHLMDNARNSILNNIVSDWVGAIDF